VEHIACQRVENMSKAWELIPIPEHEKTVRSTDQDMVMKRPEAKPTELSGENVEKEVGIVVVIIVVLGCQAEHDPVPGPETEVGDRREWRWLGNRRAPTGADGPRVHVRVNASGGDDAVGDTLDKLR
jgi:hypothetical protein